MMKTRRMLSVLALVILLLGLLPGACFAEPDDYVGDSAIYVGDVSQRAKPNVLFVLDTSLSSLNPVGAGSYATPFTCTGSDLDSSATCSKDAAKPYNTAATPPFNAEEIYEFTVTGAWVPVGTLLNPFMLSEVAGCVGSKTYTSGFSSTTRYRNVQVYLSTYGTYTGIGDAWFPSLTRGACDTTSGFGGTYATGDYLNFIYHPVVSGGVDTATAAKVVHEIPGNKYAVFTALRTHVVPVAYVNGNNLPECNISTAGYNGQCSEPRDGRNSTLYWSQGGTFYSDRNDAAIVGLSDWQAGQSYTGPTLGTYETQREVFYETLETIISTKTANFNFGVMVYNPNIQGAMLIDGTSPFTGGAINTHVQDLTDPIELREFLYLLPKGINGLTDTKDDPLDYTIAAGEGPRVIMAGPQRPLAEALFDAGHYFEASYPGTGQYINETRTIAAVAADPLNKVTNCDYNHIIMITNGLPNGETTAAVGYLSIGNQGDFDGDFSADPTLEASYGQGTHYLDDIAGYLHTTSGATIYTVLAFQSYDALLDDAAIDGGSLHEVKDSSGTVTGTQGVYLAGSGGELAAALSDILANIVAEKDTAFVAPVVPASTTNRTISSNRVYLGLFKPQTRSGWHGNVKKYQVKFGSVDVLADASGNDATDSDGDFIETVKSYWGSAVVSGTEKIFSADPENPLRDVSEGDGGIVDAGGVGGSLKARPYLGETLASRNIFTYLSGTKTELRDDSTSPTTYNVSLADLGMSGSTAERDRLVDWLYGFDAYNISNLANPRDWLLGDVLHSKPLVFNYANYDESVENVCTDAGAGYNSSVIFVGGNDGMMHAFRDCDGKELWGFVPPLLLNRLPGLPGNKHVTMVDGAASLYVHDTMEDGTIDSSHGDKVILLFGLRRGGGNATLDDDGDLTTQVPRGAYYALDVTDPANPTMLWEITSNTTGYEELAETWSQPRIGLLKDSAGAKWVVAFVGAGYDQNEDLRWGNRILYPSGTDHTIDTTEITTDGGSTNSAGGYQPYNPRGRGIFAIKVAKLQATTVTVGSDTFTRSTPILTESGGLFWKFTKGSSNTSTAAGGTSTAMSYSFPTDIAALDLNGDNLIDRLYAADMDGNMWRFDDNGSPDTYDLDGGNVWSASIIFQSNNGYTGSFDADGNYTATQDPDTSNRGRKIFYKPAVTMVSGNPVLYFGTGDREHPLNFNVKDRIYALIDRGQNYSNLDAYPPLETNGSRDEDIRENDLIDLTTDILQAGTLTQANGALTALEADTNFGWYIRLENTGEKSLAAPVVFAGQAFYTTYAPNLVISDPCEVGNLGVSRLYHLNYKTGEAVFNYDSANDSTDPSTLNERAVNDAGDVLLKDDRIKTLGEGIPSGIVTLIDASGKVTMMISASNRVGTYAAPDTKLITPVYYRQWSPE